ncbi:hypothetical protein AB3S75_037649 [Citrus x aurantiifolia]
MRNSQRTGVRQYNKSELPRLRWTPELHKHFSQAVERLGGKYKASPKRILHMMNVKGLKLSHIKSHLQMYRNLKNQNGDITLTMKNLEMQRAQCNNHGVLSICSTQAHRPVENEYTADWEYERSNYVKHQVFSEESSGLIHAKLAAGEDEHQDSQTSIQQGKMSTEEVGGLNENCELSLSFTTTPSMMMNLMTKDEEERESWPLTDGSLDDNFASNNTQEFQSLGTSDELNLDLTI